MKANRFLIITVFCTLLIGTLNTEEVHEQKRHGSLIDRQLVSTYVGQIYGQNAYNFVVYDLETQTVKVGFHNQVNETLSDQKKMRMIWKHYLNSDEVDKFLNEAEIYTHFKKSSYHFEERLQAMMKVQFIEEVMSTSGQQFQSLFQIYMKYRNQTGQKIKDDKMKARLARLFKIVVDDLFVDDVEADL